LELSQSKWLITSLSPGGGEKMSKHAVATGDVAGMLACFAELKRKAWARTGRCFPIIVIQDGSGSDKIVWFCPTMSVINIATEN
jgi:transposase